jgi:hypothetical protein
MDDEILAAVSALFNDVMKYFQSGIFKIGGNGTKTDRNTSNRSKIPRHAFYGISLFFATIHLIVQRR